MDEIDLLIFVPIDKPDFILREEAHLGELRSLVDEILHDWVWDFNVKTIKVRGDVKNRLKLILEAIGLD